MLKIFVTRILAALFLCGALTVTASAQTRFQKIADGFYVPWSLGFLPDGSMLVTDREALLWHVQPDGATRTIDGLPDDIHVAGQGGLLDIAVTPDFAQSRRLYLSYSVKQERGSGTALARATLSEDGRRLTGVTRIFQMIPGSSGGRHYGGRIVIAPDGHLFLTIGDRGDRPSAQDLGRHNGSVIRLDPDGTPAGAGLDTAAPGIWSYGHRNPQGAALDRSGRLWITEHGARGGDELNAIRPGANYGWPVIAYGRHYSGLRIGEGTSKPGMEQPVTYWDPSMAPSGLTFYTGDLFPDWRGDAFAGSLKFDYIARLSGTPLTEVEQIKSPQTLRVRDVRTGPDGAIWFLSEGHGALYRIVPD